MEQKQKRLVKKVQQNNKASDTKSIIDNNSQSDISNNVVKDYIINTSQQSQKQIQMSYDSLSSNSNFQQKSKSFNYIQSQADSGISQLSEASQQQIEQQEADSQQSEQIDYLSEDQFEDEVELIRALQQQQIRQQEIKKPKQETIFIGTNKRKQIAQEINFESQRLLRESAIRDGLGRSKNENQNKENNISISDTLQRIKKKKELLDQRASIAQQYINENNITKPKKSKPQRQVMDTKKLMSSVLQKLNYKQEGQHLNKQEEKKKQDIIKDNNTKLQSSHIENYSNQNIPDQNPTNSNNQLNQNQKSNLNVDTYNQIDSENLTTINDLNNEKKIQTQIGDKTLQQSALKSNNHQMNYDNNINQNDKFNDNDKSNDNNKSDYNDEINDNDQIMNGLDPEDKFHLQEAQKTNKDQHQQLDIQFQKEKNLREDTENYLSLVSDIQKQQDLDVNLKQQQLQIDNITCDSKNKVTSRSYVGKTNPKQFYQETNQSSNSQDDQEKIIQEQSLKSGREVNLSFDEESIQQEKSQSQLNVYYENGNTQMKKRKLIKRNVMEQENNEIQSEDLSQDDTNLSEISQQALRDQRRMLDVEASYETEDDLLSKHSSDDQSQLSDEEAMQQELEGFVDYDQQQEEQNDQEYEEAHRQWESNQAQKDLRAIMDGVQGGWRKRGVRNIEDEQHNRDARKRRLALLKDKQVDNESDNSESQYDYTDVEYDSQGDYQSDEESKGEANIQGQDKKKVESESEGEMFEMEFDEHSKKILNIIQNQKRNIRNMQQPTTGKENQQAQQNQNIKKINDSENNLPIQKVMGQTSFINRLGQHQCKAPINKQGTSTFVFKKAVVIEEQNDLQEDAQENILKDQFLDNNDYGSIGPSIGFKSQSKDMKKKPIPYNLNRPSKLLNILQQRKGISNMDNSKLISIRKAL